MNVITQRRNFSLTATHGLAWRVLQNAYHPSRRGASRHFASSSTAGRSFLIVLSLELTCPWRIAMLVAGSVDPQAWRGFTLHVWRGWIHQESTLANEWRRVLQSLNLNSCFAVYLVHNEGKACALRAPGLYNPSCPYWIVSCVPECAPSCSSISAKAWRSRCTWQRKASTRRST